MAEAEWIKTLREECKRTSQNKVARLIGMSSATINHVLKGTYSGRLDRIEARVMGALMKQTHDCPVLGTISKKRCQYHQARPFASTNPTRAMLYMACRGSCQHSKLRSGSCGDGGMKVEVLTDNELELLANFRLSTPEQKNNLIRLALRLRNRKIDQGQGPATPGSDFNSSVQQHRR